MCPHPGPRCLTLRLLEEGRIVDRRPTDAYPTFPSEFTYAREDAQGAPGGPGQVGLVERFLPVALKRGCTN